MQGAQHLSIEKPAYLSQETDTATPRSAIPIYYFHSGSQPFCSNPACFCQPGKRAAAHLLPQLVTGNITVAQVKARPETVTIQFTAGIPEECQLYGHSWEITEHPDIKECSVCHLFGYCPGCTPITPRNAQPFFCTDHAGRQG